MGLWRILAKVVTVYVSIVITTAQFCPKSNKRIHTFAFSNDGPPANYVVDGVLTGQSVDMVMEICRYAGMKCRTALVPRRYCWDNSAGYPPFSIALNQHWYDSCANLPPSPERVMSYEFMTENYFSTKMPSVIVAENSNITLEDLKKCNSFTLAFPIDTALEPDCLLDLGWFVKAENYVPVRNEGIFDLITVTDMLEQKVRDGEVDMALVVTIFGKFNGVRRLTGLNCVRQVPLGLNNMIRSEDEEFKEWFSESLHEYMCVGDQYEKFCDHLKTKYESDPLCRIPGKDLDCSKYGGPRAELKDKVPKRISPCDTICMLLEKGTDEYIIKDQFNVSAVRALRGSGRVYTSQVNTDVFLTINTVTDRRFEVKQLCITTKRARAVTFVFRGGLREAEEEVIPIEEEDDFLETCLSHPGGWNLLLVKVDMRRVAGKEIKMKIKDIWMDACMDGRGL